MLAVGLGPTFRGCVIFLLAATIPASAQSSALLSGRIIDPKGAPVAFAKVTITNVQTGIQRVTATDGDGNYQFAALPAGVYRLEVKARGLPQILSSD
ncbi:MAG TPA: carboxypeptidase-like regulatory domain-containing protein [Pyrinomonadaceae bacterium]|nr:carboxypeptidase-like regulatory domain-containing protein [Pyrinomonadaceae bacterium]